MLDLQAISAPTRSESIGKVILRTQTCVVLSIAPSIVTTSSALSSSGLNYSTLYAKHPVRDVTNLYVAGYLFPPPLDLQGLLGGGAVSESSQRGRHTCLPN